MRRIVVKRNAFGYIIIAVLMLLFLGSIFSVRTYGKDKEYFSESSLEAEKEYIQQVKEILSEYGLPHAGITLTKVSEDGINVEYTTKIHTGTKYSEEMTSEIEGVTLKVDRSAVHLVIEN